MGSSRTVWILLQRYRPEDDGIAPTPVWLSAIIVVAIIIAVWWSQSKRIRKFKEKSSLDVKEDIKNIMNCLIADIKDFPLIFLGCVAIVILYIILLTSEWLFYVILGVGIVGYLIYLHLKK